MRTNESTEDDGAKPGAKKGHVHSEETKRKIGEGRRGKKHSEETKQRLRDTKLGGKASEETRRKMSEVRTGKTLGPPSEETRKKISESLKGKPSHNKGKPMSDEQKRKLSEARKGRTLSEEHKRKISEAGKGRGKSEEARKKLSTALKGRVFSEESKQKMSAAKKGVPLTEEHKQHIREATIQGDTPEWRAKISEGVRKAYENPEFREGHVTRITSPEVREKQLASRLGVPLTPEHKAKFIEAGRQGMLAYWEQKTYEERLELTHKAIEASQNIRVSSLELKVQKMLDEMGFQYEPQKQIGMYYIDFYLPEINTILNVHGCYWHACLVCERTTDREQSEKKRKYDHKREAQLRAWGYEVITIWEHDLVANAE